MIGEKKVSPEDFNSSVLQSIDEGLMALGESVRQVVYHYVERIHEIKRPEIPSKLDAFHEAVASLFGEGCRIVEKLAAKRLYTGLNLDFRECKEWTLVDYVNHARKLLS